VRSEGSLSSSADLKIFWSGGESGWRYDVLEISPSVDRGRNDLL